MVLSLYIDGGVDANNDHNDDKSWVNNKLFDCDYCHDRRFSPSIMVIFDYRISNCLEYFTVLGIACQNLQ